MVKVTDTVKAKPEASEELSSFRAGLTDEYATYVAKTDIFIDGVRAFNAGYPVPVSHVDRGIVDKSDVVLAHEFPGGVTGTQQSAHRPVGSDTQPSQEDIAAARAANIANGVEL
jgi:hypothetical protein